MAYTITAAQKAMLLGSHEMSTRVSVFRDQTSLGDIPVIGVNVNATYGTQGGRDGYITVDANVISSGLLNPVSDQVIIYTGVKGQFEVPIFTGRVDTREADSDGYVDVVLLSRGAEAIRAAFEVPWAATVGHQSAEEITLILQDVNTNWAVDTSRALNQALPSGLVWEEDRGQALDQLAQGSSNIWQPDRTGGFVVFANPYALGPDLGINSVITLTDGVGGTTVNVRNTETRDGIWNSVTVVVERLDNSAPIRVTARDGTVGSPTFWGGTFGKQNIVVKNQTPLTNGLAQLLAARILRQSLALQRAFDITVTHMPILDPGDVFTLHYQGINWTLVVETIRYAGAGRDTCSISARELMLRDVEMFV